MPVMPNVSFRAQPAPFHPAAARAIYTPPARPAFTPPRPAFTPPPRPIVRNIYHTTYVNRGWSPEQRRSFEEGVRQREYSRLMREENLSAQVAQARAAQYAAQQALIAQQQQSQMMMPTTGMMPSASVSPGSPGADLGPAQYQAAANDSGDAAAADASGNTTPKAHHLLVFVGIAAVAGFVGYKVFTKKKKKTSSSSGGE